MASTKQSRITVSAATLRGMLMGVLFCCTWNLNLNLNWTDDDATVERRLSSNNTREGDKVSQALVLGVVLVLILLTIAFETIKENIEESVDRSMLPIIESLFGEMTVLGFLSVFTFAVTKAGVFETISVHFFGEEEHEFMLELFELVHYALFFVMVAFVCQVLLLVRQAMQMEAHWCRLDRITSHPIAHSNTSRSTATSTFTKSMGPKEMLFRALKEEFLLDRSLEPPFAPATQTTRAPDNFNFGRYLTLCLSSSLCHVVHVNIWTWAFFGILSISIYLIMVVVQDLLVLAWIWVAMGWMGLFFNIYFERKLIQIRDMLLPVELTVATKQGATSSEATSLLEAGRHSRALFPAWCSIDLDSYLTRRSKLVKRLCPHMPNRQYTLFWFECEGPHFHMLLLQINLIFIGLSCASLLLTFFPAVFKACSLSVFYMYVILAVVPLLYIALKKQQMVATMSQVSCMGSFRRPDVIATVIREQKTAHVVRAFLVLEKMFQAAHTNHTPTNNMDQEILFDGQELADITTTFEAFDKNGDGNLLSTEIATVVTALGGPMEPEKLNRMISALDTDMDGTVSKQEFLQWYGTQVMASRGNGVDGGGDHDTHLNNKTRAHRLFAMFDKNKNGKISIGEFKGVLDKFSIGFTVDEVGDIVRELDEDGNIMIGVEEFEKLLEKYTPEELQD